jgi:hypothetical protein
MTRKTRKVLLRQRKRKERIRKCQIDRERHEKKHIEINLKSCKCERCIVENRLPAEKETSKILQFNCCVHGMPHKYCNICIFTSFLLVQKHCGLKLPKCLNKIIFSLLPEKIMVEVGAWRSLTRIMPAIWCCRCSDEVKIDYEYLIIPDGNKVRLVARDCDLTDFLFIGDDNHLISPREFCIKYFPKYHRSYWLSKKYYVCTSCVKEIAKNIEMVEDEFVSFNNQPFF